jgi:hypothetical protein
MEKVIQIDAEVAESRQLGDGPDHRGAMGVSEKRTAKRKKRKAKSVSERVSRACLEK